MLSLPQKEGTMDDGVTSRLGCHGVMVVVEEQRRKDLLFLLSALVALTKSLTNDKIDHNYIIC